MSFYRLNIFCVRREFAKTVPRPFSVRYNPYTQSVDILDDKSSIQRLVSDIKYEVDVLQDALTKLKGE